MKKVKKILEYVWEGIIKQKEKELMLQGLLKK